MYTGHCFVSSLDLYVCLLSDCEEIHIHQNMHEILSRTWRNILGHAGYRPHISKILWILHPSCLPLNPVLMSNRIGAISHRPPAAVAICTWGKDSLEIMRLSVALLKANNIDARLGSDPQALLDWLLKV